MISLVVAASGFLLAGLVAILYGAQIKDFSFGNTLITSGVIGVCTGAILFGVVAVLRELRAIAENLAAGVPQRAAAEPRAMAPPRAPAAASDGGLLFPGDRAEPEIATPPATTPPAPEVPMARPEEPAGRDRLRPRRPSPEMAPPEPAAIADDEADATAKRRSLLFTSSRKDRERDAAKAAQVDAAAGIASPDADAAAEARSSASPPSAFEEAWPSPRGEGAARRAQTAKAAEPEKRTDEARQVTVLKSGVVDGMAYSLYSDGSIEAQMPEGMMRFASIDELRAHLDQRS